MPDSNGDDRSTAPAGPAQAARTASLLLGHIRRLGANPPPPESFHVVFRTYYGKVQQFFSSRGYDPDQARDLTQDTFLRVYRGRGVFESTEAFNGWLFKIATHVHRNAQRALHAAKRNQAEESLDVWIETRGWEPADAEKRWSANPLEKFLALELRAVVGEALKELPPKMRRCFLLSLQGSWTYREIGKLLGIAEGTVKAQIFQARQRVSDRIESYRRRGNLRGPQGGGS